MKLLTISKDDHVTAFNPRDKFLHLGAIDDGRTVDSDKLSGVELRLDCGQGSANNSDLLSYVQHDMIFVGFDPIDIPDTNKGDTAAMVDRNTLEVGGLLAVSWRHVA